MNDIEGLNLLDFLATGINKNDPVIQAVLSGFDGKGASANEIAELIVFIDYYTKTDDVKNHVGDSLEMIVRQFSILRRQLMEPDNVLLRRMLALTYRKGDVIWGNALDIEHVFETYVANIKAFVCENTDADSLLIDGDFEEEDTWGIDGGASFEYDARFSGKRGLYFPGSGDSSCSQNVTNLEDGVHTLHFFLKGDCGVIIKNNAGKFWNGDERILEWTYETTINRFKSDEWSDVFCFIVPEGGATQLYIRFVNSEGEAANIDYARLFLKPLYPSYTVVVQYEGYTATDKTMHLGLNGEDPVPDVDYEKESYFDHTYITGRQGAHRSEVFVALLDIVRPRGIRAFVEFVEKIQVD